CGPRRGGPGARSVSPRAAGQNLYRIALQYGVRVETLRAANGLSDVSRIEVGQALWIPETRTRWRADRRPAPLPSPSPAIAASIGDDPAGPDEAPADLTL